MKLKRWLKKQEKRATKLAHKVEDLNLITSAGKQYRQDAQMYRLIRQRLEKRG